MKFIDIHTHFDTNSDAVTAILNVNIASNEVWDADIAACSVGIHPWHIEQSKLITQFFLLEDLCKEENVIAVGEIGLDKTIEVPLFLQQRVLEQQMEIADYHQKPIIIHCVRAFSEFLAVLNRSKINIPIIIHGFNKNEQVAKSLLAKGCYLSLGSALLQEDANAANVISTIPSEQLFLETDVKQIDIATIYAAAAQKLKIDINDLKSNIYKNYKKISNKD
jgi:TatD DNase family protein